MTSDQPCTDSQPSSQPPLPSWRRSDLLAAIDRLDDVERTLGAVALVEHERSTGTLARAARDDVRAAVDLCHELVRRTDQLEP